MSESKQVLELFESGELVQLVPENSDPSKQTSPTTFVVINRKSLPEFECYLLGRPELISQVGDEKKWKLCGPNGTVPLGSDGKKSGWLYLLTRKFEQLPDFQFGQQLLVVVEDTNKDPTKTTFHCMIKPEHIQDGVKVKVVGRTPSQLSKQNSKENSYKKRTAFRSMTVVDDLSGIETMTRQNNTITKTFKEPNFQRYLKAKGVAKS